MKRTQDWSIGSTVKVGFMSLTVLEKVPTPGNYLPDQYVMVSATNRLYCFTPYNGLERCATIEDARAIR